MLLIGLLFVALACLVLGLVLASGPFLIGSLAASIVAGIVLFRQRDLLSGRPAAKGAGAPPTTSAERQQSLVTGTAFTGSSASSASSASSSAAPVTKADEAAVAAAPGVTTSTDVWVVDGKALFHSASCERIKGLDAEPIPYEQALEDGFTICSLCKPRVGVQITQVWVVDGKPDYHLETCTLVAGADPEQIPRAQAVEDGFTPCRTCRPDGPAAADAPMTTPVTPPADDEQAAPAGPARHESAAATATGATASTTTATPAATATRTDTVWVVDGRPRYHRADCMIIADQDAEEIPLAQATEDGFMPCSLCTPSPG